MPRTVAELQGWRALTSIPKILGEISHTLKAIADSLREISELMDQ